MLREIVIKELRDTFSSTRFMIIFSACTVLILLSVFTGLQNYQSNLKYYQAAQSVMRDTIERQVSYEALGLWGEYKVYKRPPLLSGLVEGLEGDLGRNTVIHRYYAPRLNDTKFNEQPIYAVFGSLDVAFVVKVVLSLLALVFTYDAICGERERGTLKQIMANAIPRDTLILGKLLGSFLSLVLPLAMPLLLGLLMFAVYPGIALSGEDWLRALVLLGLFLIYTTIFLMLGIFISTRTARSSLSFLVSLIVWVLFVLVIPRVSVMLAAQAVPVPSGAEVEARKQALGRQWYREFFAELERWRQQHPEGPSPPTDEQVPQSVTEEINRRLEERFNLERRRLDEAYMMSQRRQLALATWVSRLSPMAVFSQAAMRLAHTGIDYQERFLQAAQEYQRQFADYIEAKMREERRQRAQGQSFRWGGGGEKLDISDMPQFSFRPEPLGPSLRQMGVDIGVLVFYALLCFLGAYVSFLRYDVR